MGGEGRWEVVGVPPTQPLAVRTVPVPRKVEGATPKFYIRVRNYA